MKRCLELWSEAPAELFRPRDRPQVLVDAKWPPDKAQREIALPLPPVYSGYLTLPHAKDRTRQRPGRVSRLWKLSAMFRKLKTIAEFRNQLRRRQLVGCFYK